MLILKNIGAVVMALALMHIHNFHCQIVNGLKMLFLQLTTAFPSMLIIEKIYILVLGDGSADGLYHTTRTAEAKYSITINKLKKKFKPALQFFVC